MKRSLILAAMIGFSCVGACKPQSAEKSSTVKTGVESIRVYHLSDQRYCLKDRTGRWYWLKDESGFHKTYDEYAFIYPAEGEHWIEADRSDIPASAEITALDDQPDPVKNVFRMEMRVDENGVPQ